MDGKKGLTSLFSIADCNSDVFPLLVNKEQRKNLKFKE